MNHGNIHRLFLSHYMSAIVPVSVFHLWLFHNMSLVHYAISIILKKTKYFRREMEFSAWRLKGKYSNFLIIKSSLSSILIYLENIFLSVFLPWSMSMLLYNNFLKT